MDWNELMSTLTEVAARSLPLQEEVDKDGNIMEEQPATIILELPPGMTTVPPQATFQAIRSTGPARRIPSAVTKKGLCPYCHKEFNAAYLVQHIRIHTGEKPFTCEFCNKSFRASIDWKNHRRVHTGERPYKCNVCGKTFKQNTNLLRHMIRHGGKKPFQCDICLKMFWSMWGMQTHRRAHLGEYSFACKHCGERFVTKGQLDRHNLLHDGKELHKCPICSRLFVKPRLLELHMSRHEGLSSALCDLCGQGYARRESLARHMKTVHGMEYIYTCETCGKPFMTEEDRFKHSVVHMEGTCPICGKMFSRLRNLKNHIMAHMEGTNLANIDEDEMERRRRKMLQRRGPISRRRRGRPPKHTYLQTIEETKYVKKYPHRDEVKIAKVSLRLHQQLLREMRKELRSVPVWKRRNILVIHKLRGKLRLHQMKRKSYYKKILARLQTVTPEVEPAKDNLFDQVENAVAQLHGMQDEDGGGTQGNEENSEPISRPNPPLRTFERPKNMATISGMLQTRYLNKSSLNSSIPNRRVTVSEKAVMTDNRGTIREQGIMTEIPWAKAMVELQGSNDCDKVPLLINKNTLVLLGWPYKSVDDTLKQVVRHLGHVPLDGPAIQVYGNQAPGVGRVYSCTASGESTSNVMLSVQPMEENVLFIIPVIKNATKMEN